MNKQVITRFFFGGKIITLLGIKAIKINPFTSYNVVETAYICPPSF